MSGSCAASAAAILLLVGAAAVVAQETPQDTTRVRPEVRPSEPVPIDTLAFGLAPADTVPILARRFRESEGERLLATVPSEDILPKNPRNAALRSFLLPGWGQIYTGHPWRAALFAAGEIGFFTAGYRWQQMTVDKRREIREAREAFFADTSLMLPDDPDLREQAFQQTAEGARLFSELRAIRDRREDFFAWAMASVIFSAVDAYVAAQLDPIKLSVDPTTRRFSVGVHLPVAGRR